MKIKILGIFVCMLLLATAIPAVGINDVETLKLKERYDTNDELLTDEINTAESQEPTGLFGWVFLRGFIFNPREDGSKITARAINLQYTEINFQGVNKGVARLKKVSFRNGFFIKMSERGLFGYLVHVSGFCHGGLEIL